MTRSPLNWYEREVLIMAMGAAMAAPYLDAVEVEEYRPEPPRMPDIREQLEEMSRGTPTKGPTPRRRYPVRR